MSKEIKYNDLEALCARLVGRRIVETRKSRVEEYGTTLDSIEFVLDDGIILEARESDGGCGCSNGCFSVVNPETPTATIMGVKVVEEPADEYTKQEDLDRHDGEALIRMFVMTEFGDHELVRSEGGDNGYYGWGYHVFVKAPQG